MRVILCQEQITELLQEYKNGELISNLVAKYGVSERSIFRLRQKYGVKRSASIKRTQRPPKYDLSGQQFGQIKVLRMKLVEKPYGRTWKAVCRCLACGRDNLEMGEYDLRMGKINSCGCLRNKNRKYGADNSLYTGHGEISGQRWSQIKAGAKRRGYHVVISIEEAWRLYLKQNKKCALTSLPISFGVTSHSRYTASLDRIDSSGDYERGNVQWVHRDINLMKRSFPEDYFVHLCRLVADYSRETSSEKQFSNGIEDDASSAVSRQ